MTMTDADTRPEPTTYERLAEPFAIGEHAMVNKGGMDQTYAPWTEYVERMTAVLGANNWSNRIVREGFTETECWVLVEVEAVIDGQKVVHQQYGCEPITKGKDARPTTDLLKSTASDALKKAISLFGPGLYLSVKEERLVIQQAMREAVREEAARQGSTGGHRTPPAGRPAPGAAPSPIRPPQAPQAPQAPPEPLTASDRAGLEHRYEALREHAQQLGARTSWLGQGAEAWNDVQLPKYVGLLEGIVSRHQGAA